MNGFEKVNHNNKKLNAQIEENKLFKCKECESQFKENGNLKRHVALAHKVKKSFECTLCDAMFKQKASLKGHILLVHEGLEGISLANYLIQRVTLHLEIF